MDEKESDSLISDEVKDSPDVERYRRIVTDTQKQYNESQKTLLGKVELYLCMGNALLALGIPIVFVATIFMPRSMGQSEQIPHRLKMMCEFLLGNGGLGIIAFGSASCVVGLLNRFVLLVLLSIGLISTVLAMRYLIELGMFGWVLQYASL